MDYLFLSAVLLCAYKSTIETLWCGAFCIHSCGIHPVCRKNGGLEQSCHRVYCFPKPTFFIWFRLSPRRFLFSSISFFWGGGGGLWRWTGITWCHALAKNSHVMSLRISRLFFRGLSQLSCFWWSCGSFPVRLSRGLTLCSSVLPLLFRCKCTERQEGSSSCCNKLVTVCVRFIVKCSTCFVRVVIHSSTGDVAPRDRLFKMALAVFTPQRIRNDGPKGSLHPYAGTVLL